MFTTSHRCRFKTPRIKSRCNRMMVDGSIVNDLEVLLQNWAEHFEKIATSR